VKGIYGEYVLPQEPPRIRKIGYVPIHNGDYIGQVNRELEYDAQVFTPKMQ
jgi:hypothetical protein